MYFRRVRVGVTVGVVFVFVFFVFGATKCSAESEVCGGDSGGGGGLFAFFFADSAAQDSSSDRCVDLVRAVYALTENCGFEIVW